MEYERTTRAVDDAGAPTPVGGVTPHGSEQAACTLEVNRIAE